jgi:LPS sulfotransferase NodH
MRDVSGREPESATGTPDDAALAGGAVPLVGRRRAQQPAQPRLPDLPDAVASEVPLVAAEAGDLAERTLSTAQHDQRRVAAPSTRLLLCTTPRSGSYLLSRQLIRAGLGVPHEYLNPVNAAPIQQRVNGGPMSVTEYLAWLDQHRTTPNGVFAAKMHWPQLSANPEAVDRWFRSGPAPTVVFLTRRRLSAQAHSLQRAAMTGVWDASGVTTVPPRGARSIGFSDIDRLTFLIVYWNAMWRLRFEAWAITPIELAYEDVVADQPAAVTRIGAALGLAVDPPPVEPPPPASLDDAARAAQITRYAESWVGLGPGAAARSKRRFTRAGSVDAARSTVRHLARRLGIGGVAPPVPGDDQA